MAYYISESGKIKEYGGKPDKEKPLSDEKLGFENKFEDKERAFYIRDRLLVDQPRIFLKEKEPTVTVSSPKSKSTKTLTQDEFREAVRKRLGETENLFWTNMERLAPKDMVDTWIKLLQYGYSRAPVESVADIAGKQRLVLEETTRKATLIGKGLPEGQAAEFEEEQ